MTDIEKLARELYEHQDNPSEIWELCNKDGWILLARHVAKMVLDARIDEMSAKTLSSRAYEDNILKDYLDCRLDELQSQLKELKNAKDV